MTDPEIGEKRISHPDRHTPRSARMAPTTENQIIGVIPAIEVIDEVTIEVIPARTVTQTSHSPEFKIRLQDHTVGNPTTTERGRILTVATC
jgi:uncharacterized protein (DUF736 family)